ncbi:TetR/AcrR family transcriptional regulator [Natrialbaceae archaeon A-arb3/5]
MKGFSDDDRERIRDELVAEGQSLFSQFGLERTRIKDITDAVGIGTSTFYQFFDSKEELYGEVLLREHQQFRAEIDDAVENADSVREQIRATLQTMFVEVDSSPLIYRLIVEGELRSLQANMSEEEKEALVDQIYGNPLEQIEAWTEHPQFRHDDPRTVNTLLRNLIFTSRSRNVIQRDGEKERDEAARELMIDVVVDGLFVDE